MKERILMLGPDPAARGGVSTVVQGYLDSRLADSYDILYVITHTDGGIFKKFQQAVKGAGQFLMSVMTQKVNIVHIHMASRASFYRKLFFFFLAKAFRKKIVLHLHGAEFNVFYHKECGPIARFFIRWLLRTANKVIALSQQWRKDIIKITHQESNIVVVFNAVETNIENKKCDGGPVNILFMGDLGKRKGIYDLVRAAEQVAKSCPQAVFSLCGTGEIGQVKDMVTRYNLDKNFCIPGWVTDRAAYYRKGQIYVLPSYNEGLPMSLLEAASYGLPLVSTPVGGIPEIIEDGVNGFLVQPGDVSALAERLEQLIESQDLRRQMGQKARETVETKFALDKIVNQIDLLYQRLLDSRIPVS